MAIILADNRLGNNGPLPALAIVDRAVQEAVQAVVDRRRADVLPRQGGRHRDDSEAFPWVAQMTNKNK